MVEKGDSFIDVAICENCKHCKKIVDDMEGGIIKRFHYTCKLRGGKIHPNDHCMNFEITLKAKRKKEKKEEIKKSVNYSKLQKESLTFMVLKNYDKASELIVKEIEKENHIYTTKNDVKSEMWIYEEGIYKPNGKAYVKEFSRKILGETYTVYIANIIISKIETDSYIKEEDFFVNNNVDELPVENGILNVKTRKLLEFDPKKIFFNKLPVEYNENATCDNIDKFLRDILTKEEDITVAYEIVGSGLLKEYFTEKAAMLVGEGRNGKSKFLELIKRLSNVDNTCSVPIRSMREDNSSLCELHGKLFNLAGDLSGGDLKDTGVFKQTVGRDILQAHRKFLTDLKFVNYAKHIFACNELPRVFDTTDGFWDKWVLLKFPYKFITQEELNKLPEQEKINKKIKDQYIIDKISTPEELSGFLNKALDGLDRLLEQNNFSQTEGSKEIKDFWIRNSDSFAAFCIDNIEESYDSYIPKKQIRNLFSKYCKKHKIKGAGDKSIKATLEDRYGAFDNRKMFNNEITPVWEGIKFKTSQL
jgi:putative DNA primase/helicase